MNERPDIAILTNPRADRVKAVKALSGRSVRARRRQFLAEGPQSVREAVAAHGARRAQVRELYGTDDALDRHPDIAEAAEAATMPVRVVTDEVMAAMSADAQGLVAVVDMLDHELADIAEGSPRLALVLARVRDPGNAGTAIRVADAMGADAVILTESSVDPYNPKVVRSSAGSLFHCPIVVGPSLAETAHVLRSAGMSVLLADGCGPLDVDDLLDRTERPVDSEHPAGGELVADGRHVAGQHPTGPDEVCAGVDLRRPTAWVFGNEAWGMPDDELVLADAVVRIPMRGAAESLNLGTAVAICLHASARAHRR